MGGGGKSGGASQQYNYYGTLAGGVCIGPNEDLVAIILDGQEVWPQGTAWALGITCVPGTLYVYDAQTWTCTSSHTATAANAPGSGLEGWVEYTFTRTSEAYDDFSLTASDGTYYGVMRFYWGTNAQTVDPLLESTGNDGGVTGSPCLITGLSANGAGVDGVITFSIPHTFNPGDSIGISGATNAAFNVPSTTVISVTTYTVTYALASTVSANLAAAGTFVVTSSSGSFSTVAAGDQHPDYEGLTYVIVMDFLLGQEVQSGPNIEIVTRRKPNQSVITGADDGITDGQANLAAVAAEILLDENCLGLDPDSIDATSFQAVADWLQTNQDKYGASVLIDSSESVTSLFDKLTQMIDGYIRFNPTTKKVELGVYQHGVVPGGAGSLMAGYVTLTEDSLTKYPKFNSKSWQETISRATVRYSDRQLNYQQTSVQVDDPRAFFVLGTVREQSLDRPWIARAAQAYIHGRETLRVIGHAQMTGELEVRREIGRNIRAGDMILVDVDLEPNANSIYQFFRVTQRKMPPTGPITLSVFADNTLASVLWNNPYTPILTSGAAVPPITSFRFLQSPATLTADNQSGEVLCLAQRPNSTIVGGYLYFDTDPAGTFSSLLGNIGNFAAKATLTAPVLATDATLQLTVDATQVDADYFTWQYAAIQQADDEMLAFIVETIPSGTDAGQVFEGAAGQLMEICSVGAQTLVSAGHYTLSVLRGRQGTLPLAFATPANVEVWLIPRAFVAIFWHALFSIISGNRVTGNTPAYAQFRLCPFTRTARLPLSDAASEPFHFPLPHIPAAPIIELAWPLSGWTLGPYSYPKTLLFSVQVICLDQSINFVQFWLGSSLVKAVAPGDSYFISQGSYGDLVGCLVTFPAAGSYTVKVILNFAVNQTLESDIAITVN